MHPAAVENIRSWHDRDANLPPQVFPDFGTISMARGWGGRVELSSEGNPFIHPAAETVEQALSLEPGPCEDIDRAIALLETARRQTGRNDLGLRSIDFQGPLNTAAMIVRQEALLMGMFDQPEAVHHLLQRITERNIGILRELRDRAGRLDGNIWPFVWVPHDVGVCMTEDMMPLLSPEQYIEFGLPYLQQVAEALGPVFIHCCGEWARHAPALGASGIEILGAEVHLPFTRVEDVRPHLPRAVIVPYVSDLRPSGFSGLGDYVAHLLDGADPDGPLWIAVSDDPNWHAERVIGVLTERGLDHGPFCG